MLLEIKMCERYSSYLFFGLFLHSRKHPTVIIAVHLSYSNKAPVHGECYSAVEVAIRIS